MMSYDIYIWGLKTAIEYQGKQHFESIDYFGGEKAFKKLQQRDIEKQELSKKWSTIGLYKLLGKHHSGINTRAY